MDLLIFSGQSNMQGQTEAPVHDLPVENAWEYRLLTDSLEPLVNPVGEDIGELILASHLGHGSLVPYFTEAYTRQTKRSAVAVHVAKGATIVWQWLDSNQEGAARYGKATEKILAAMKKIDKVDKKYLVWLQGESDALAKTSLETYKKQLTELKNNYKRDIGIDGFCIIEVGYFAHNFGGKEYDEIIQRAQEELCREDEDFVMLTDVAKALSLDPKNINPEACGHYNNAAMRFIGETAGTALANHHLSK